MPVLRHGDYELFESKAIATYLDRVFPGPQLIPADPRDAALTEQWVSLVNAVVDRTLIRTYIFAYIAPKTSDGTPDRAAIEAVMPAGRRQLPGLPPAAPPLARYYAPLAPRPSFVPTDPPAGPPRRATAN